MSTDAQFPPARPSPASEHSLLLAPWWHTALLTTVLLLASVNGSRALHPVAAHSKLPQYIRGITWEWILVAFTWLGIRKRVTLRALIGGRWSNWEEFFLDLIYAGTFWFCALIVLGFGGKLMHLDQAGRLEGMRRQLDFLVPASRIDLAVWFFLSATAGFCEEIVFRGYLQRQFTAMTRSTILGVLLSAFVFGASHGYEGAARMLLIGIYGLLFGILAWWRNSLRPGMMAHGWHDAISGVILRIMK